MADEAGEILQALESGAIENGYGLARRVDTHLSHVFLAKDRAIKLKRRVELPFADFRALEMRRDMLQAELALNRRTAPDLYLEVLPITRAGQRFALGGDGPVLDWALVMRRFPDEALFDTMAKDGRLSIELVEATAERIAAFHRSLAPSETRADADYYAAVIDELEETEAHGATRLGITRSSEELFAALGQALDIAKPLIEARCTRGHVRRGHGDLHLRNIYLWEGKPTLFDALEFDEALATHDTLYDFGFLLMDLRHRDLQGQANAAMNCYWNAGGEDEDALGALSFFMALRAAVRMAISVEMGKVEEADAYGRLGLGLLKPVEPRLVAIGGLSGTGKSALARVLAPELDGACGARLLRSDVVRKQLAGTTARLGGSSYSPEQRLAVYRVLTERATAALVSTSAVADATFREAETRAAVEHAAGRRAFTGLWLTASSSVRLARVSQRRGDPSDATVDVAAAQTEPEHLGPDWRRIDAAGDPEMVLARARDALGLAGP